MDNSAFKFCFRIASKFTVMKEMFRFFGMTIISLTILLSTLEFGGSRVHADRTGATATCQQTPVQQCTTVSGITVCKYVSSTTCTVNKRT